MKKMKKFFAVILSLAMVLGMSITAFAVPAQTETASITVKNANGANVKYVQVVQASQTAKHGWEFVNDAYATAFKNAFGVKENDDAIQNLIDLGKLEELNTNQNAQNGVTNTGKEVLASQFATALSNINISGNGTDVNADSYVLTDKATAGLYVIKATKTGYSYSAMAAYVAFDNNAAGTLKDATVTAKGTKDQVSKEIDTIKTEGGVEVDDQNKSVTTGDEIKYTITQAYPYYPANVKDATFTIVDKVTNASFNQDSLTVTSNDEPLTAGKDYAVQYSEANGQKIMTIIFTYDAARAGQIVKVKYSVTVDDISAIDNAKVVNEATATANGKYTVAEVESASVKFTVKKIDADDTTKAGLSGAKFRLYIACDENAEGAVELTVKGANNTTKTVWAKIVSSQDEKTTGNDGTVTFYGLDADKTYYVLETKAPAGYSINKNAIQLTGASVTMGATSSENVEVKDNDGKVLYTYTKETTPVSNVTNFNDEEYTDTKLSALPSTGGIGTTIFTIAGCAIMIAAAGFFFASRKKANK